MERESHQEVIPSSSIPEGYYTPPQSMHNSDHVTESAGYSISPAGSLHKIDESILPMMSPSSNSVSEEEEEDESEYQSAEEATAVTTSSKDALMDDLAHEIPADERIKNLEDKRDQENLNNDTISATFLAEDSYEEDVQLHEEGKPPLSQGVTILVNGLPPTEDPPQRVRRGHQEDTDESDFSLSSCWTRTVLRLHGGITHRFLQPIARMAATYPRFVLIALALLSVTLIVVGFFTNFRVENQTHLLWPPQNSLSVEHSDWLYDESSFNYAPVEILVLVHANGYNPTNAGVLGREGVERVFDILDTVTNIEGYQEGCEYAELFGDFYSVGQCSITSVADFWNQSRAIFDAEVDSDDDAIRILSQPTYPTGVQVDVKRILGNTKYHETQRQRKLFYWEFDGIIPLDDDEDDDDSITKRTVNGTATNDTSPIITNDDDNEQQATATPNTATPTYEASSTSSPTEILPYDLLASADSYLIKFAIPWSNVTRTFEASAVQELLALRNRWEIMYPEGSVEHIPFRIEIVSQSSYEDEFMRSIVEDLWLIPIAAGIVGAFTIFFAFGKWDRVKSRGLLGLGSVATIVGSLMTTFGLMFIIGVPFTTNTLMLPFLMFGIGLDDAFIIYGSYHRKTSKTRADIPKRIEATMEDVGVSIFLTSMTSMLAFILGSFSAIPAVRWLCLYAFPCIGIDFLYQITFFIALIVLDEERIQDSRMDYLTCIRVERELVMVETDSQQGSKESEIQSGEHDGKAAEKKSPPTKVDAVESGEDASAGKLMPVEDTIQHPADRIMGWFAVQILKGWFQCLALLVFAALSIASIYWATKLEQQFDFTDTVPHDSYLKDYYLSLSRYTQRAGADANAYFRDVDQSDPVIQQQMMSYLDALVADGDVDRPVYFWLTDFDAFLADREKEDVNFRSMAFEEQMDEFLRVPIYHTLYDEAIGREYNGPVGGRVFETRCSIYINVDRQDSKATVDMLSNLRDISGSQPINQGVDDWRFFTYDNNYHLYEFYQRVVDELVFTTIMGVIAVNIIAIFLIPHWTAVLFTLPFISLLYCNMLGWLYIAGVQINALSYVTLVMSIGLMIDYIMHILMRYYEAKGNRRQKIHETMSSMGSSIFLGAASTFLGLMALAFSTSDLLQDIFVSVCGLIVFGVLNGLVFLPVTLSLIGPE